MGTNARGTKRKVDDDEDDDSEGWTTAGLSLVEIYGDEEVFKLL